MSDLNPYEESLAIDLATAQARIEELEAQITAMEEGLTAVHMAGYMDGRKAEEAKQAAKRAVANMNAVRNFPDGTCPASRHVAMMAEELAKGKSYHMLTEEPEHCAASMAATVTALWECRAKLAQQDDLVQAAVAALTGYDAKAAGAKDAGEGFDLAISMALAAIRKGGE